MDKRLYFILGDLFSNLFIGILVSVVVWLIVGTGWNMWLAMIFMMPVGMFTATLLWVPCGLLFGAMEVMVPAMLTGMLSGMIAGMISVMHPAGLSKMLLAGAICGLISILSVWLANSYLRSYNGQSN